ncbi:serine hydrolase [Niallia sp. FSL W8-0951]|uniref:serine hydrolase domain-containing protein n=1 Tax=Niallia TaxID=2837506 RepID=UPI00119EB0BD|nr:serine hydrolase [Niallia circulans]MCM2983934.1 beta-lactamase family protein [Niallia circulans]MED5102866.1 serine hydrolase [Niallia circulans]
METSLENQIKITVNRNKFSGTILIKKAENNLFSASYGYANRSDNIKNTIDTRFGIASGCKLFTSIAICQLVEKGKLSFESKLEDCLPIIFPNFNKDITIHHLLTHTAGIPDYFDEEIMDDFEELWIDLPMYHIRKLTDFLPLFQNKPMKSSAGEKFHYNNAGYILLGLVIEEVSKMSFTDFIEENIFKKVGMQNSGYYELDALPKNTALGYIDLPNNKWRTNIYSLPAKGGADGGAFVTALDMSSLWNALLTNQLLSDEYTSKLLTPFIQTKKSTGFYGYGLWIEKKENAIFKYHIMGYDPGVNFHSAFYPKSQIHTVICSNKSEGAFEVSKLIEDQLILKME